MAIDQTTESISHFIGLFALAIEKMVLREQYEEFRADQKAADKLDAVEADPFKINAGYRLKDYDPDLNYKPPTGNLPGVEPVVAATMLAPAIEAFNVAIPDALPKAVAEGVASVSSTVSVAFNYLLPIPSSIVAVTIQIANLNDNDAYGEQTPDMFVAPVAFNQVLSILTDVGDMLTGFEVPDIPATQANAQDFAFAALEQVQTAIAATPVVADGANVAVISGEATVGITVNGEAVTETLNFSDLLPAFMQPEKDADTASTQNTQASGGTASNAGAIDADIAETAEAGTDDAEPAQHDFSKDFEQSPNDQWKVEDGHEIVAGANLQVNEVQVTSSWLDAGVIAVQGDVIKVDAISQVNVFAGQDVINGEVSDATSTAINLVEIIQTSSDAPAEEELEEADDTDTPPASIDTSADAIEHMATTLSQNDDDEVETEPEASAPPVYEGLPTDSVVVHVEGDVTQINWTVQDSYITDNDTANVTISASATYLGLGDNTSTNQTLLSESGFNYDLILVGGDLIDVTMITQTNVLLDGGSVETDLDEGAVEVSSGDNLQFNAVELNSVGVDTEAELEDSFAETLEALEEGGEDVTAEVESSDHFDGVELLRVLYIEGDYISINVADQTNVLADVDQINIAQAAVDAAESLEGLAEEITEDTQADISVIMGSNAQGNIATVQEFGTDSIVMAGGDYYSEALIHQADLIDTDAVPTGVEIAALANEAVAFLADDLLDANAMAADIIAGANSTIIETAGQSDVMQTVLS
ncbi:MAG: hypothetical protein AAGA08_14480 [Pseudomonadota bacterium]